MTRFEAFVRANIPEEIPISREEVVRFLTGKGFTPKIWAWGTNTLCTHQFFNIPCPLGGYDPNDGFLQIPPKCRVTWIMEMVDNVQIRYVPQIQGIATVWPVESSGLVRREVPLDAVERCTQFIESFMAKRSIVAKTVTCPEPVVVIPYGVPLFGPNDPIADLEDMIERLEQKLDEVEEIDEEYLIAPIDHIFASDLPDLLTALSEREAAILARIESLKSPVRKQTEEAREWAKSVSSS